MADLFGHFAPTPTSPIEHAVAVTPHDSNDLANVTRTLYVGVSGDVKVDMVGSGTVTFTGLAAGLNHPIRATRVYATGTTATSIIAGW
jgi:hypothetical protein